MLRAIDRHKEAAFFLDKVIDAFFAEDEHWRFYFNALVSATRSISFVLQKDLRTYYGEEFDLWWNEQKANLIDPHNFARVRDLRNILEKEGGKWPLLVLEVQLDNCIFKTVRVEFDQSLGKHGMQFHKIELSQDTFDLADVLGETPDELQQRVTEHVRKLLRRGVKEFWAELKKEIHPKVYGFLLPESTEVMDVETMLNEFSVYLRAMARLLESAHRHFHDLPERMAGACSCIPTPAPHRGG